MEGATPMQDKRTPRRVKLATGVYLRDGRVYEVGYRAEGKQRWLSLPQGSSETDAKKARLDIEAERAAKTLRAPEHRSVRDVWRECESSFEAKVVSGNLSARTLDLYRQRWEALDAEIGDRRISSVLLRDVEEVLDGLRRKKLSAWTVHGYRVVLSVIFKRALKHGYVRVSPLDALDEGQPVNKSQARVLTAQEVDVLLGNAPATYRDVLATLAYSGLRVSEALGLTWGDVDLDGARLNVEYQLSRSKKGERPSRVKLKTEKARRRAPMLGPLAAILRQRYEGEKHGGQFPASTAYVFRTATGGPLNYHNAAHRGIKKAAETAGISGISCHDLRHTFASIALQSGVDVSTVSRWLGHANVTTTLNTYSHYISTDADELHAQRASRAFAVPVAAGQS